MQYCADNLDSNRLSVTVKLVDRCINFAALQDCMQLQQLLCGTVQVHTVVVKRVIVQGSNMQQWNTGNLLLLPHLGL